MSSRVAIVGERCAPGAACPSRALEQRRKCHAVAGGDQALHIGQRLAKLPGRTVLCAELPCSQSDAVWRAGDEELGGLMMKALAASGIPVRAKVIEVSSRRLPQAYPLYTLGYREHFERIDQWLNGLDGILTFGRQGLFAHDNTHHALAMAYAASDCMDDSGAVDAARWQEHRRAFQHHVVED